MLATSLFDYDLPPELIARHPANSRDGSKMMVLDRVSGETEILPFPEIKNFLSAGDLLVRNNTRVLLGRMFAKKNGNPDGARFELLLLEPVNGASDVWNVLLKPGKRALAGVKAVLLNKNGELSPDGEYFKVVDKNPDGSYKIEFSTKDIGGLRKKYGHIPLPPYLNREAEVADEERYQTVYAKEEGAVAAPTAGLHFTQEIFAKLQQKHVDIADVTLHVGAGTFKPVSSEYAEEHKMHVEAYWMPETTADKINAAHHNGKRVLAVGTTSVRTIESCADIHGEIVARHGTTDIFLYPPRKIRAVDMLLTNFHLPKSTLLMLVSCFCDREKVLAAYERAVKERMRFYSYGDCMLLK